MAQDPDAIQLSPLERNVAQAYALLVKDEEECRVKWERLDRKRKRLAKLAGLGRKKQVLVRISETHAVKIVNQFRGADKVFTPAFCRKLDISKVKHDD